MSNTTKSDRPVIATGGTSGGVNRATPHKRYDPRLKRGRERWEGTGSGCEVDRSGRPRGL